MIYWRGPRQSVLEIEIAPGYPEARHHVGAGEIKKEAFQTSLP